MGSFSRRPAVTGNVAGSKPPLAILVIAFLPRIYRALRRRLGSFWCKNTGSGTILCATCEIFGPQLWFWRSLDRLNREYIFGEYFKWIGTYYIEELSIRIWSLWGWLWTKPMVIRVVSCRSIYSLFELWLDWFVPSIYMYIIILIDKLGINYYCAV